MKKQTAVLLMLALVIVTLPAIYFLIRSHTKSDAMAYSAAYRQATDALLQLPDDATIADLEKEGYVDLASEAYQQADGADYLRQVFNKSDKKFILRESAHLDDRFRDFAVLEIGAATNLELAGKPFHHQPAYLKLFITPGVLPQGIKSPADSIVVLNLQPLDEHNFFYTKELADGTTDIRIKYQLFDFRANSIYNLVLPPDAAPAKLAESVLLPRFETAPGELTLINVPYDFQP